ncbi:MAG: hypothetical protein ACK5MR_00150 [Cumulibacter sp.]
MSDPRSSRHLIAPTVGTGALMAAYLWQRPYGDADGATASAEAFASRAWVIAHVCGLLALASLARLAARVADVYGGVRARAARTLGLAGAVLVLPYYGAETFALHEIARHDAAEPALVEAVRGNPVAMTMFGIGLVFLAASALLVANVWARNSTERSLAAVPLGVIAALFLPQFFLAPGLRIAYGALYLIAAAVFLVAIVRSSQPSAAPNAAPAVL